jgi:hypothetical protein
VLRSNAVATCPHVDDVPRPKSRGETESDPATRMILSATVGSSLSSIE